MSLHWGASRLTKSKQNVETATGACGGEREHRLLRPGRVLGAFDIQRAYTVRIWVLGVIKPSYVSRLSANAASDTAD